MPTGLNSTRSYLIRGIHPEEAGATLEQALVRLIQFWDSRRSLHMHEWGNLRVTLQVGNREVNVEFVHPGLLDLIRRDPSEASAEIIKLLGLGPELGKIILDASSAKVAVDALRIPGHPTAWKSEADPEVILPASAPWMLAEILKDIERKKGRGPRRKRNKEAMEILNKLVADGVSQGKTAAQIAREFNLPSSTVRDTMARQARERAGVPAPKRVSRTDLQQALRASKGNAAEAARKLNIPERTMRDARAREARLVAAATRPPPDVRAPETKSQLLQAVAKGEKPSIAAKRLGIAPRTARGWAHEARYGPKKKP